MPDRRMMQPDASSFPIGDVREKGFARRSTVVDAIAWIDRHAANDASEDVPVSRAAGRILSREIVSRVNVPPFDRAMMDGYAVRACDTTGASTYNRIPLAVIGRQAAGEDFGWSVGPGQAVCVMTGAPMPRGADAVLPFEWTELAPQPSHGLTTNATPASVFALSELSPGKHVGPIGEDVAAGSTLFQTGRRLRPQDIGAIASIGVASIPVARSPRVRLIVTGSELVPAGSPVHGAKIIDANGPMLAALIERDGGIVDFPGIVPDDREALRAAIASECVSNDETDRLDVTIVSGGSSVGQEDHAPQILAEMGELAIHGIAMRPSSPAGMGRIGRRLVFLLPGNPVSCLCAYDFFAGRAIRLLGRRSDSWPYVRVRAPLARKLTSVVGRVDYARVRIVDQQIEPLATGGASVLTSTTRADGFVIVPADSEGYPRGETIDVFLYDAEPVRGE